MNDELSDNQNMKWYFLQIHTGQEDLVKDNLAERIRRAGQDDLFGKILVPTEQVVEMIKGKKKTSSRKFFPGYILIQMYLNDDTWHTVRNTARVSGFVGDDLHPNPLSDDEASKIIRRIEEGELRPKPKVMFENGDIVRVTDGPFANFQGEVDEVFPDKGRIRVMVSIFGRSTPVELEFAQVCKA